MLDKNQRGAGVDNFNLWEERPAKHYALVEKIDHLIDCFDPNFEKQPKSSLATVHEPLQPHREEHKTSKLGKVRKRSLFAETHGCTLYFPRVKELSRLGLGMGDSIWEAM